MITKNFLPFDPVDLIEKTEEIVCKGDSRKYTHFYCTGVYGGISTGYTAGCCLRCVFCWVDFSREYPEKYGEFYSAEKASETLIRNARKKNLFKLRISGGEPTLCRKHLLGILKLIKNTQYLFILETNGILFGHDRSYVEELKDFKNIHVRVSLKAGNPEGFERRTGAKAEFFELPFKAIKNLMDNKIPFHVASMSDFRLMERDEKIFLLEKLKEVKYFDYLEEERCDPYDTSIIRLRAAGIHFK
ncbi:MAG: radical SAM protein [Acidobacteriota bacterium]